MSERTRARRASDRHRPFVVLVRDLARAGRGVLFVLRDAFPFRSRTNACLSLACKRVSFSCLSMEVRVPRGLARIATKSLACRLQAKLK
ncbi:MC149.1 [Molluscum contagiosum virus subtype 2]|uniref:MC149.1 n=2 Tax=Molluscum contagiosum virus TaxID=10279 RepID=A0A1S7DLZ0_MCV2|nr:MC149.1 [Molluscum contagiosum virus subtype 2]QHW16537.1 MC149.1R [Molluscum contagiosum virus]AYO87784.1 MC149.1 [Molluscum contagiosum virus subtype 2]AYO87954.1 MC149.1 [Molluscum contagiosum virus subtype 2]AYO88124.1 MC149.1 [Molluscum contagiosum virus subtype 2]